MSISFSFLDVVASWEEGTRKAEFYDRISLLVYSPSQNDVTFPTLQKISRDEPGMHEVSPPRR